MQCSWTGWLSHLSPARSSPPVRDGYIMLVGLRRRREKKRETCAPCSINLFTPALSDCKSSVKTKQLRRLRVGCAARAQLRDFYPQGSLRQRRRKKGIFSIPASDLRGSWSAADKPKLSAWAEMSDFPWAVIISFSILEWVTWWLFSLLILCASEAGPALELCI